MSKTIGFGIIGCGTISKAHAKSITQIEGAKLVAVSDIVESKAQELAKEYSCTYYTDYNEMLKNSEIDIVCICTPSGMHSIHGIDAAKAGKHIIVEKPIDITLEAADRLLKACEDSGVKLTCISQHRYDAAIIELKKAVEEGKLGQLNFSGSHTKWYRGQDYYDSGDWRGTWALDGGGALMNQSVHYVDMMQYIMGPVEEVFAYCATRAHVNIEVEDIAVASVKFKSGAIGIIEGNTAAFPGYAARLDIYGSDGSVIIENDKLIAWKLKSDGIEAAAYGGSNSTSSSKVDLTAAYAGQPFGDSHTKQIKEFAECVRNNAAVPIPGIEGRSPLAIILAIYESARTGKSVLVG